MHFKSSYIKSDLFKLMEKTISSNLSWTQDAQQYEELGCQRPASDSLSFGNRLDKSYLDLKLM